MMMKPGGRLIAVGDRRQAIYGFTGADSDSLDKIQEEFNTESLPLSVTYRCPKNIVKMAHDWVDESVIQAHESAPEGIDDTIELSEIYDKVGPQDAILCRNTKPLVELAYSLLRRQIACKVEGRKIGEGMINLARKWKTVKTVGQLTIKLEEWKEREIAKNKAKGNNDKCQQIEDQADTLAVFMLQCEDSDPISVLVDNINKMFTDTKEGEQKVLTLSTIHKAKGREWDHVFALGMGTYSPSKYATKKWELEQEDNLCYVQVTRVKKHLTMVTVPRKKEG
jgi:superfamily I DNA/RNA helicase